MDLVDLMAFAWWRGAGGVRRWPWTLLTPMNAARPRGLSLSILSRRYDVEMRYNLRFCLLAIMPFVALLGTIWVIGLVPRRDVSPLAHVLPAFGAEAFWIACLSLHVFWNHRDEDR